MALPRAQRRALLALLLGSAVCAGLAFASALTPPTLISGGSVEQPPVTAEPVPIPSATDATPLPRPTVPAGAGESDAGPMLVIIGTVLAVALAIVLVLATVRAARAFAARPAVVPIDDVAVGVAVDPRELQYVLRRAREQIALDEDANRAVIRCWESLEQLGAQAGMPRADSETATDYVQGILAAFALPGDAATRLSRLYDRALFSSERLSGDVVVQAREDLDRLDAALAPKALPHRGGG